MKTLSLVSLFSFDVVCVESPVMIMLPKNKQTSIRKINFKFLIMDHSILM